MKPKRRMNETQIEKKAQKGATRIDQFKSRKLAEEPTNGKALRNIALEQLAYKIKEELASLSLQTLLVRKLLLGLPNVLNKNNSIPQVHCAISSHFKCPRPSKGKASES